MEGKTSVVAIRTIFYLYKIVFNTYTISSLSPPYRREGHTLSVAPLSTWHLKSSGGNLGMAR